MTYNEIKRYRTEFSLCKLSKDYGFFMLDWSNKTSHLINKMNNTLLQQMYVCIHDVFMKQSSDNKCSYLKMKTHTSKKNIHKIITLAHCIEWKAHYYKLRNQTMSGYN